MGTEGSYAVKRRMPLDVFTHQSPKSLDICAKGCLNSKERTVLILLGAHHGLALWGKERIPSFITFKKGVSSLYS